LNGRALRVHFLLHAIYNPHLMPSDARPDLSKNVRVFGFTSFLNDTASEMAYWVLPAFIATIGGGPAQLGVIEGIAESVAAGAKYYSGVITDRLDRRKPLVVSGYAIANLAKPLLAFATAWWHVLLVRFADRTAKGIRGAPRDVMISESVPHQRVGGAFGLLQSMDSAGAIVGPLAAWLLLSRFNVDIRHIFLYAAIPGLLCIFLPLFFVRETKAAVKRQLASVAGTAFQKENTHLSHSFQLVLAAVAIFSIGNSSDMFLILRAQDIGISAAQAPLLGLVFNLVYTAASWPAGRLSDKLPRRYLAAAGYLVFAVVYFTFAVEPNEALIWLMMGLYGLYYALTQPVLKAMVIDLVPHESRGRAIGLFYLVSSITALLASLLTGGLWKLFGGRVPFYLSATLAVVAALMILWVRPPQPRSQRA
jgi:MFS family permease